MTAPLHTQVLVIGSGAGGALTAATLAEANLDVTVIEEGPWLAADSSAPFSLAEMTTKYRYGGPNAALGNPPIAFVEGRCVGGGTEINSGLYHRVPVEMFAEWSRRWGILDVGPELLERYAKSVEDALSVGTVPGRVPDASAALERGAGELGWDAVEVPRVFRYPAHEKQTMTRTFIPRAVASGARIEPNCRVLRLLRSGDRVTGARCRRSDASGGTETFTVHADHVFVCAGAIETPALLQRSGVRHHVGRTLKIHPMIKLAARFPGPVDDHTGVPMHQVREFGPDITLGGSVSRPGYVALALGDSWEHSAPDMALWENTAVYYAAIRTDGRGRVRTVPGFSEPIVSYRLTEADVSRLARGLVHLAQVLFAAGAVALYPSIAGSRPLERPADIATLWDVARRDRMSLMTVHIFSSLGMGERRDLTGTDSYGRVWRFENLWVNDGSLLPDSPGVNPQGSIMAIAARNCDAFLSHRS